MRKKVFRAILSVAGAVLLASLVLIFGVLYAYFSDVLASQLADETALVAQGVENEGRAYLDSLDAGALRVTWIAGDGTVLFDSQADADQMENHADRPEFQQAEATGTGTGSRVSATLAQNTLYAARRLTDGSVIRLGASHSSVPALLLGVLPSALAIALLAAALAALLARRVAKRIVGPLNALDLDHPLENDAYEELAPLLTRVSRQQRQIAAQLAELRRRRDEFSAVTDSMNEGLVLLDERDCVLSINRAAARIFRTDADCAGRNILTLDRSPALRALLEKAAAGERGEAVAALDGREYQLNASPVLSDGGVLGTALLAFDVTDRRRAEQLRREFTANVSHELKTPLQSIMGAAELLEGGLVRREDEKRFLARIRSEAARLVALVEDIIRLSRLDEGGRFPEERTALLPLAREAAESLRDAAARAGVTLTVSGEEGPVTGVRQLLWEIVWNLCDNAVRYNRPGGRVEVTVARGEGETVLTVADTGIGIPPEHQSRVFERFYRVDKSHSRTTGGTGLGLSIVKHAAQYHGAAVSLESAEGRGTTVRVVFPDRAD